MRKNKTYRMWTCLFIAIVLTVIFLVFCRFNIEISKLLKMQYEYTVKLCQEKVLSDEMENSPVLAPIQKEDFIKICE